MLGVSVRALVGALGGLKDRAVRPGSKNEATVFVERWTLVLDGSEARPWRILAVGEGSRSSGEGVVAKPATGLSVKRTRMTA